MNVGLFVAVLVFILLDIVSGLVKAFASSGFDSSVMRQGAFHKLGEILAICLMAAADYYLPYVGITVGISFSAIGSAYFSVMEIGSIIENIGIINPELVGPLTKIFAKLKGDE